MCWLAKATEGLLQGRGPGWGTPVRMTEGGAM